MKVFFYFYLKKKKIPMTYAQKIPRDGDVFSCAMKFS